MTAREICRKFDKEMQANFNGDYGAAVYDEALQIAFMMLIHERIKEHVDPRHHLHVDIHWYGTWLKLHPLHPVRTALSHAIGRVADASYDPKRSPLAATCEAIGNSLHSHVVKWANPRERGHGHDDPMHVKVAWMDSKVPTIDAHIKNALNPPRR